MPAVCVLVHEFLGSERKRVNVWVVCRSKWSQQTNDSHVYECSNWPYIETQQQNLTRQHQFDIWGFGNKGAGSETQQVAVACDIMSFVFLPCTLISPVLSKQRRAGKGRKALSSLFNLLCSLYVWNKYFGYRCSRHYRAEKRELNCPYILHTF